MDDDALEWKLRAAAIPGALLVALAFHAWPTGHMLQRTFLTMIVHEVGHAITAWWCGFGAAPGLWKTLVPEARGAIAPLCVAAAEAALVVHGWRAGKTTLVVVGLGLGALQLVGTSALSPASARAAITFGGDGGAMVLGTVLMACFFVPRLAKGGVRWGLVAIGAAAFVDTFATWWTARTDPDVIPFGEIEGVGQSDPSKLVDVHGWSEHALVGRYVALGVACLLALAAIYAWGVRRATSAAAG